MENKEGETIDTKTAKNVNPTEQEIAKKDMRICKLSGIAQDPADLLGKTTAQLHRQLQP